VNNTLVQHVLQAGHDLVRHHLELILREHLLVDLLKAEQVEVEQLEDDRLM
jgi:hypothetical protein